MHRIKYFALVFSFFLISCASSETVQKSPNSYNAANTATAERGRLNGGGGGGREEQPAKNVESDAVQTQNNQSAPQTGERKIIRNAEMKLEVESPETTSQKITEIAESKKGFVVESNQSTSNIKSKSSDIVTMTIRVPADKFNETLEEIRQNSGRLIDQSVKGQDVTEEFIDLEATLKAKKALEDQFIEIMKRSNTVEDALNVQKQLAEVRGEIEKIEGRKRFIENQASFSTIRIQLQTPATVSVNSGGFLYRLTKSLSSGLDFALDFILGLIAFLIGILPFILFVVLPLYFIVRYFWRKNRTVKTTSTPADIVREEIKED